MTKKDNQNRLVVPEDIWNMANFDNYQNQSFAFFLTEDSRVVIANISLGTEFEYEFLGKCSKFDQKRRFYIPKNVDTYLGDGDTYYFSTPCSKSVIYLQKVDNLDSSSIRSLTSSIEKLVAKLDTLLQNTNN